LGQRLPPDGVVNHDKCLDQCYNRRLSSGDVRPRSDPVTPGLPKLRDRARALRARTALRSVDIDAAWLARASGMEKSDRTVDTELYTAAYDLSAPAQVVQARGRWHVRSLVLRKRFEITRSINAALSSGVTSNEIEGRLTALHPENIPGLIALGCEPEALARVRLTAEFHREWLRLLRTEGAESSSEYAQWLRHAGTVYLDLMESLATARNSRISVTQIAAILSVLDPSDAEDVLAMGQQDWDRKRVRRLRHRINSGSDETARQALQELGRLRR
jgi:hypothetical protein